MNTPITDPTALADQIGAVAAHARRVLDAAADHGHAHRDPNPPRAWLAEHAAALRTAINDGTVHRCPHVASTPRLLFAAAWCPGRLVCLDCLHTLDPDPAEAVRCDHCHRPAPWLQGVVTAFGPVLFTYALCARCVTGIGGSAVAAVPLPGSGSAATG